MGGDGFRYSHRCLQRAEYEAQFIKMCCRLFGIAGLSQARLLSTLGRLVSTSLYPRQIQKGTPGQPIFGTRANCHGTLLQGRPCHRGGACLVYLVYLGKRPDRQSGINGDFTTRNTCTLCDFETQDVYTAGWDEA